jgi:hypothetical protein
MADLVIVASSLVLRGPVHAGHRNEFAQCAYCTFAKLNEVEPVFPSQTATETLHPHVHL